MRGRLVLALAAIDPSTHLWFARSVTAADVAGEDWADLPGCDGVRSAAVSFDLAAGIGAGVDLVAEGLRRRSGRSRGDDDPGVPRDS